MYCLHGVEQASELVIHAFVCQCSEEDEGEQRSRCQVRRVRAAADFDVIIGLLQDASRAMKPLLTDAKGEFVPIVQKLTRRHLTPAQEMHVASQLIFFLTVARAQLKGGLGHRHSAKQRTMHQPLLEWHTQMTGLLRCIRSGDSSSMMDERFRTMQQSEQNLVRLQCTFASECKDQVIPLSPSYFCAPRQLIEETTTQVSGQCLIFSLRQVSETLQLYYHPSVAHLIPTYDIDAAKKTQLESSKGQQSSGQKLLGVVWPLDLPLLINSLRSAIIIGIGSIFILVPSLAAKFEQGSWILISMCMTQGNTQGGAYLTMRNRLFGTFLGSVFGYLCYLAVGNAKYHFFGLMVPWILVCTYARYSPSWSYAGTIATITPLIIILGNTVGQYAPEDYAILRIQENVLGICLGAVLNLLLFPISAADTLNVTLARALEQAELATNMATGLCQSIQFDNHISTVTVTINAAAEEKKIFGRDQELAAGEGVQVDPTSLDHLLLFVDQMNMQAPLMDEAAAEPRFLVGRFPLHLYRNAWIEQQRLIGCLINIDRLLKRILYARQKHPVIAERLRSNDCVDFLAEVHTSLSTCKAVFGLWRERAYGYVHFRVMVDNAALKELHPALIPADRVGDSTAVAVRLVKCEERLKRAHANVVHQGVLGKGTTSGGTGGDSEDVYNEVLGLEMLTVLGRIMERFVQLCSDLSTHLRQALEIDAGHIGEVEEVRHRLILPY